MKTTIVEPSTAPELGPIICIVTGIILIIIWRIMISSSVPDYGRVVSFLKGLQGIEAEDAGETSSSYLFNVSVSAITQHFDLNAFVEKMRRLGCSVLSTADTNNPSFRTLTVQVPKSGGRVGLSMFLFIGCFLGSVLAGFFYQTEVYNISPLIGTIIGNVQEKTKW